MRYLYVFILAGIFLIQSCKTPYFNTANKLRQINGTVYTQDGKEISGQLTHNLEDYSRSRLYVSVVPVEGGAAQKINLTDIKGVNIRGDYYEPKLIDMGGLGNNDEFRFVKRLTKEGSRIHLYELYEQRTRQSPPGYNSSNNSYTTAENTYYITTPSHTKQQSAWNLEGRRLTPDFENKMSEIVKDCPSLAAKIKSKEKGYFYAQISLVEVRKIETMFRIIDEYNKCAEIK